MRCIYLFIYSFSVGRCLLNYPSQVRTESVKCVTSSKRVIENRINETTWCQFRVCKLHSHIRVYTFINNFDQILLSRFLWYTPYYPDDLFFYIRCLNTWCTVYCSLKERLGDTCFWLRCGTDSQCTHHITVYLIADNLSLDIGPLTIENMQTHERKQRGKLRFSYISWYVRNKGDLFSYLWKTKIEQNDG